MSAALDALLAELTPPQVPAGLAGRIAAAVQSTPQEPHSGRARRAAGRDRRGRWRRGLVIGAGALGLVVSSAVAATLAGVPLPAKVEAVIAKLPLIGRDEPGPVSPIPRPRPAQHVAAPAAPLKALAEGPAADPVNLREVRLLRRLAEARRVVEARRAAGLPTPRADRIERRLEHRIDRWRQATPEERQRFMELRRQRQEMRRARIEARRAGLPPPFANQLPPPLPTERPPPMGSRPVYGPVDPRTVRAPAGDGAQHRLRDMRVQRLERLRGQRLERVGVPTTVRPAPTTRPAPVRRAPPPMRREGLPRTTR